MGQKKGECRGMLFYKLDEWDTRYCPIFLASLGKKEFKPAFPLPEKKQVWAETFLNQLRMFKEKAGKNLVQS